MVVLTITCFFLNRKGRYMTICLFELELISTIALLYCVHILIGEMHCKIDIKFVIHGIVGVVLYLLLNRIGEVQPVLSSLLQLILLFLHVRIYYQKKAFSVYRGVFVIYVLWDFLHFITALLIFPCIYLWKMEQNEFAADLLFVGMHIILYILIIFAISKKKQKLIYGLSRNSQMGIVSCCMVLEFAILELRSATFHSREVLSYRILLVGIIFSCIVIVLWILDKREEQKKIRELTSYVHKTREIIPSVGRALKRLEEMPGQSESAERLLEELRSICEADAQGVHQEVSYIKTFESTGCFILDEQLGRYMEEACEKNFQLDIIVRASVDEILETEQINRYQLLQLIGDLYRNAYKVVLKRNGGGHILMCFGYNMQGFYEISIYDNGAPFPVHILNHLGERGVTTDGSGHGMADIFAALKEGSGSFDLNQNMPPNSIFTKGICIIFDGQARVQIQEGGKKK